MLPILPVHTFSGFGHEPHAYLRDVLGRLPAMTTADDLHPLLPSQWKPRTAAASSLS